jgi:hypothetical protein
MATKKSTPYAYLIGWTCLDIWYYGSKYGKNADPELFWKNYWTSSNYVKLFREQHGEPDVIQIRRTFDCPKKAIRWERQVHLRMNCKNDSRWLNQAVAGEKLSTLGKVHAMDSTGKKMLINSDDPRYISGELISSTVGMVNVKDSNGNRYAVSVTNQDYQSGILIAAGKGLLCYNNGIVDRKFLPGTEPRGFIRGKIKKNAKFYHDEYGNLSTFEEGTQPEGWIQGYNQSGRKCYNDGKQTIKLMGNEIPPEGFTQGMAYKGTKKQYNNGHIEKRFVPGTEPEGWTQGMIYRGEYYSNGKEIKRFKKTDNIPKEFVKGREISKKNTSKNDSIE